jgi:valyl-tRNA synthetase
MIMAGHEYMDQKPFEHVYFTGIVRDKQGRKMSKSLGNSPDLLALIDVYGADAVRFGIMISSPAGNDILFDESALEQGRNFNNKLWNVLKLIQGWEKRIDTNLDAQNEKFAMDWFENRLSQVQQEVDVLLNSFKLSEALKTIYSLIWDDYCSWYLEWIKPGFEQPISKEVYDKTVHYLNEMMHMLHPFMPFITEEIYHLISPKQDDLCNKIAASVKQSNTDIVAGGELLKQVISALRDARNKNQLKPKDTITLHIQTANTDTYKTIESILCKQVNATSIAYTNSSIDNTIVVAVEKDKFFIGTSIELDATALKATLLADLAYQKGFLESVSKKLCNERFVQNAKPEVVALEQQKQADAIARIATIEESLQSL